MKTVTKIKNITDVPQRLAWVPKHGITLAAKEEFVFEGELAVKNKRVAALKEADIASGKVSVIVEYDTSVQDNLIDVPEVEEPEVPEVETSSIENIEVKDTPEDDDIRMPGELDEPELDLPPLGLDGEEIESEPVFDLEGNEITDEDDADAPEVVSDGASLPEIPSKTALKKMTADALRKFVAENFQHIDNSMAKNAIIAALDELR